MIRYSVDNHVANVVIDKPERLNALDDADMRSLAETWHRLQADDDAWVAVLSGAGGRAFSAGGDVKSNATFDAGGDTSNAFWADPAHGFGTTLEDQLPVWKPVIAAIDGYCLGGGLTLALGADIRLCTTQSTFGMPEVRIGINTVTGAAMLPKVINRSTAAEMLLAGDNIDADEALRIGLVSHAYKTREELDTAAAELAGRITRNAPLAVRATKEIMVRARELPLSAVLAAGEAMRAIVRGSADFAEGVEAVRDRREPKYVGR